MHGRSASTSVLPELTTSLSEALDLGGSSQDQQGFSTIRKLGTGSSGLCYLMRRDDGSTCVQKRIPVSHISMEDQEKVEREVNILAALDHPHIIRYERAFVRSGLLCIVMEHASGGDLAAHLATLRREERSIPHEQVLDWFVQLLLALQHTHSYKV